MSSKIFDTVVGPDNRFDIVIFENSKDQQILVNYNVKGARGKDKMNVLLSGSDYQHFLFYLGCAVGILENSKDENNNFDPAEFAGVTNKEDLIKLTDFTS